MLELALAIVALSAVVCASVTILGVMDRFERMNQRLLRHLQETQLYGGTPAGVARAQVTADIEAREREQLASIEERQRKAAFERDMYQRHLSENDVLS